MQESGSPVSSASRDVVRNTSASTSIMGASDVMAAGLPLGLGAAIQAASPRGAAKRKAGTTSGSTSSNSGPAAFNPVLMNSLNVALSLSAAAASTAGAGGGAGGTFRHTHILICGGKF